MVHWFVTQVYPKALNAAVYTLTGGLVTTVILAPFRAALKKIWRAIDSLDPDTDTGVTKQLKAIERRDTDDAPLAKHRH